MSIQWYVFAVCVIACVCVRARQVVAGNESDADGSPIQLNLKLRIYIQAPCSEVPSQLPFVCSLIASSHPLIASPSTHLPHSCMQCIL